MIFLSISTSPSFYGLCHTQGQKETLGISLLALAPPIARDCYCLLLGARLLMCRVGFLVLLFQFYSQAGSVYMPSEWVFSCLLREQIFSSVCLEWNLELRSAVPSDLHVARGWRMGQRRYRVFLSIVESQHSAVPDFMPISCSFHNGK